MSLFARLTNSRTISVALCMALHTYIMYTQVVDAGMRAHLGVEDLGILQQLLHALHAVHGLDEARVSLAEGGEDEAGEESSDTSSDGAFNISIDGNRFSNDELWPKWTEGGFVSPDLVAVPRIPLRHPFPT